MLERKEKAMEKVSMNKLEMARRAAKGGSGGTIPPATSETLGGVKIGAGVNVAADGTISVPSYVPPAYSTDEVDTLLLWIDGKKIYRKVIELEETSLSPNSTIEVLDDVSAFSTFINAGLVVKASSEVGFDHALCYMNIVDNKLYMKPTSTWNNIASAYLIIEYTKVGA